MVLHATTTASVKRQLINYRCIPMAYGLFLLLLALYKSATIWKENSGLNHLGLVKVLVRDQAIYFSACVCSFSILL